MVDEQVARNGSDPSDERPLRVVVARESAVHLDEDLLSEVLGVVGRSGEAVAEVVDSPVIGLHDFLPGGGVTGDTAPDQHRNDLDVFHWCSPENYDLPN